MSFNVSITGIGCVSAYGVGSNATWQSLLNNEPACRTRRRRLDGSYGLSADSPSAEILKGFMPSSDTSRQTRPTLLARIAADEAWGTSAAGGSVASERAGLIVNRNFGQHQIIGQYYETLRNKGPSAVSGMQFIQTIANSVLGALALRFQLRGPSSMHFGPTSLCAALDLLRDDAADVVLAGGFDELSDYVFELCHSCLLTWSSLSDGAAPGRPYDSASCGVLPSEGSAFFVLERPEHAKARGIKTIASLKGYGTVTDRQAVQNPAERHWTDIAEAIRRALCDADVGPEDVSFVVGAANGIGTIDQPEIEAVVRMFPQCPPVFSVKGGVGETWGASGCISVLAAVRALADDIVPPTTGTVEVINAYGANIVTDRPIVRSPGVAVVLSAEMSSQNTALVVEVGS